jgi:hypothetical protein
MQETNSFFNLQIKEMQMKIFWAIVLVLVITGCGINSTHKTSSEVPSGEVVTLSLPLRDQILIRIPGDSNEYYVGKESRGFDGGMVWVRTTGEKVDLQEAVRRSFPTPITGTWVVSKENDKTFLTVYADAKMISGK